MFSSIIPWRKGREQPINQNQQRQREGRGCWLGLHMLYYEEKTGIKLIHMLRIWSEIRSENMSGYFLILGRAVRRRSEQRTHGRTAPVALW